MQMLFLEKATYSLVSGIYLWIGQIYMFLFGIATNENFTRIEVIENFTQTIYVLAGVFMLFRIGISFLNMLIDPDKMNSGSEGPTKILTRVVVSVLLLLLLTPKGFIFSFLDRIEDAVLNPSDGLITNLTKGFTGVNISTITNDFIEKTNPIEEEIKDVDAKTSTCYFMDAYDDSKKVYAIKFASEDEYGKREKGQIKIDYNAAKADGYSWVTSGQNQTYFYKSVSGYDTLSVSSQSSWSYGGKTGAIRNNSCPDTLYISTDGKAVLYNKENDCKHCTFASSTNMQDLEYKIAQSQGTVILNEDSKKFAGGLLSTFISCNVDENQCNDIKDKILTPQEGEVVETSLKNNDITLSWLLASLVGIIVVFYLLLLCIEVIVRQFKLMFLQMIAPIPVISYVDPKDKVFNQWVKMFTSTYLDLFLKLLAIGIGTTILSTIDLPNGLLKKFFIIIAVLIFIKAIPTMISKIFGIDISSGTFKNTIGMLKAGAGAAVGAGTGLATGLVTGAMAFGATKGQGFGNRALAAAAAGKNTISGAVKGATGGSKGKVGAGMAAASKNLSARNNYQTGITAASILTAATVGKVGLDYATRIDKENQDKKDKKESLDQFTKFKGNVEDTAESGKFMKTIRQQVASGTARRQFEEKELQDYRDTWAEYQIAQKRISDSQPISSLKNQLQQQVDSGQMTQSQADAQVKNAISQKFNADYSKLAQEVQNIEQQTGLKFEVEAGKQSGIMSAMEQANATIEGNSSVRETTGNVKLESFKNLKDANTKAKQESTKIGDEIYRSEATDEYRLSKAARDIAGKK